MKVELDLSAEQLTLLDTSLKDCLLSLTAKQKTELLQNYINTQLESFRVEKKSDYWRSTPEYEYTDFGKQITDKMSDRIEKAITDKMLDNEELTNYINEVIANVRKNLQHTIESSISTYIINHMFQDKDSLQSEIMRTIYNMRSNNQ